MPEEAVQHHLGARAAEMGRRRQAQKRMSRDVARELAFEDFVALGVRRSKQALLAKYQAIRDKEGPQAVPTLSYDTLTQWSKEDNWLERALERDREGIAKAQASSSELREQAAQTLPQFLEPALGVIRAILTGEDTEATPATRLRAAELALQLNGLTKENIDLEQDRPLLIPPVGTDGEEFDLENWYRSMVSS